MQLALLTCPNGCHEGGGVIPQHLYRGVCWCCCGVFWRGKEGGLQASELALCQEELSLGSVASESRPKVQNPNPNHRVPKLWSEHGMKGGYSTCAQRTQAMTPGLRKKALNMSPPASSSPRSSESSARAPCQLHPRAQAPMQAQKLMRVAWRSLEAWRPQTLPTPSARTSQSFEESAPDIHTAQHRR